MDLRKAFDSVPRKYLFQKLAYIGITGTLFNVLKDIYSRNKARVRIDNKFSAYFEINSGVMQGSKLGPSRGVCDLHLHGGRLGLHGGKQEDRGSDEHCQ